jgi:hypothetical protein
MLGFWYKNITSHTLVQLTFLCTIICQILTVVDLRFPNLEKDNETTMKEAETEKEKEKEVEAMKEN